MSTLSIKRPAFTPVLLPLAAASVLLVFLVFGRSLMELVYRWDQQEEYSHGYLIPLVSAWLLWMRRDALRANIGQPSIVGAALVFIAIAMHIIGDLSAIWILSQVGFVIALMGIVLAIGGYTLLRVAFIPLAYLLFAIPLPYFIDATLTLKLQLLSSQLGVFFIRLFQIPVYLDGNIIDMGTYKLQVIEACSGLRYLYPLLSLSFLAAYLFHGRLWQRVIIFLSAIPIAIGMNGFRIGLVGLLVDRWGTQMAEGVLHFFEGWVIFLACSALLAGEMYLLALFSGRRFLDVFHAPKVGSVSFAEKRVTARRELPLASSLFLLCAAGVTVLLISGRSEIIPERTRFVAFPMNIADWKGQLSTLDTATEQFLKVDDYILANYSQADSKVVNFYIAYYASQRKNESPHSPIVCLPGGGWSITNLERRNFSSAGLDHPYNRVVIQNGKNRQLVYYWFDERGRAVADEYWAKWYLLTDAILINRTDGALVRFTTPIYADESEQSADHRLLSFITAALPRLTDFLPAGVTPTKSAILQSSAQRS
jgi:exosortase D (VPLPA-CTERM-specific)